MVRKKRMSVSGVKFEEEKSETFKISTELARNLKNAWVNKLQKLIFGTKYCLLLVLNTSLSGIIIQTNALHITTFLMGGVSEK